MYQQIFFAVASIVSTPPESPVNSYHVFLAPRQIAAACSSRDVEDFRNRTYTFRSDIYPFRSQLTLRDGRAVERSPFGKPEWETTLTKADTFRLDDRPLVLLVVTADHVGGTGRASHVLVAECRNGRLIVLFEAGGLGIREAALSTSRGLSVTRSVWSSTDAHCCPSKEVEERYLWKGGRFAHVTTAERPVPVPKCPDGNGDS